MLHKKWHIQNILNSKPILIQPKIEKSERKTKFQGTKFLKSSTKNFDQTLETILSDLWILSASVLINYVSTNKQEYISQSGIIDIATSVHSMIYCT